MSLHALAGHMATKGRHGDSVLVHMAPGEVAGLHALARAHGEKLTINPETGLPEAFKLKSLLPMILGAALGPVGFGLSATMAAGVVGAGYGLAKGSLKEGLLAGLGAYGGAGLAGSLASAGVSEAAAQEAFKSQAAEQAAANATATGTAAGTSATEAMLGAPTTATASTTGAAGAPVAGTSAADSALMGYEPVSTATAMPGAPVDPGMLSTAGYTPPTGLEALKQGAQSIYDKGTFGEFAKANKKALYAAGASALMAPEDEEGLPKTKRDPGYIRPARYDWRTGKYEYFEPVDASKWGTRNLSEYTNANDPNARTPIGRKGGGLAALANGGAVSFAGGGMTPEQYQSINQFLATNPSAEALANAQKQYGVSDADLAAARQFANTGAPPGTPNMNTTQPVVGAGGYSPFEMPGGTTAEGYSRDYSPQERLNINQTWLDNQHDPQKVMELMSQYGVSAKDLALSYGMDQNTINQYLIRGGASADFGGINTDWDTQKQDEFIAWQNSQPNPYGQGTLADVYKAQGISDTDPRRRAQAQEAIERQKAREGLRAGITGSGGDTPGPAAPPPVYTPPPGPAAPGPAAPPPVYTPPPTPGPTPPPVYTPPPGPYNPPPPMPNTPGIADATTGGSRAAYEYLSGKGAYPTNPYLPEGTPIAKPYWEAVGMDNPYKGPKVADELTNPNATPKTTPPVGKKWAWNPTDRKWVTEDIVTPVTPASDFNGAANGGLMPRRMALGGLGALAGGGEASQYNLGGYSDGGRLLRGPGDGVSDDIPATIGGKQPARLADGEFVVPARIVSELGNGSTEAGARKLYAMMDRVQKARGKTTGKNRVAANSRADKHLPA